MAQLLLIHGSEDEDLLECPDFIVKDANKYLSQFINWEKKRDSRYYEAEDFINWINEYVLHDSREKVYYVRKAFQHEKLETQIPTLSLRGKAGMTKLMIIFESTMIDLVQCPDFISEDPIKYLNQFINWKSKRGTLCYDTDDFINWMNDYLLEKSGEKVSYLKRDFAPNEEELKYPTLHI